MDTSLLNIADPAIPSLGCNWARRQGELTHVCHVGGGNDRGDSYMKSYFVKE